MKVLRDIGGMRRLVARWRTRGERVVLVPTMGNLHDGHLTLMALARRRGDRVVASIFVNPTQFGPGEDYATYPRTPGADERRLRSAGVDALFTPSVKTMYPRGEEGSTTVSVPDLSVDLCGAWRPGHFDGVTSIVLRLFNAVTPDVAVFGEKDYQQLVVLRRMVEDLHLAVSIIGAPIVRERDGLAMSSRNQYLDAGQRRVAPMLHMTLQRCRERLLMGDGRLGSIRNEALRRLRGAGFRPDYVEIRNARDLSRPASASGALRILAAARLGRARLIDNVAVRLPGAPTEAQPGRRDAPAPSARARARSRTGGRTAR